MRVDNERIVGWDQTVDKNEPLGSAAFAVIIKILLSLIGFMKKKEINNQ